jgi:hypothetical protein
MRFSVPPDQNHSGKSCQPVATCGGTNGMTDLIT